MLDNILNSLDKVRKVKGRSYTALCPVHKDTKPSMTITETNRGDVLIHCFSCGAKGTDIVRALGLPVSELFIDELKVDKSRPYYPKEQMNKDKHVIEIYNNTPEDDLSYFDKKLYIQCKARFDNFNQKMQDWIGDDIL